MNYCVCCGRELPFEGTQVCFDCQQIASEDKPKMLEIVIDDLEHEYRELHKRMIAIKTSLIFLRKAVVK